MTATATRSKMVATPRYSSSSGTTSGSLLPGAGTGNRKQSCADRSSRDQHRITVMLIIVVIVFLMCQLPQAIQHIYNIYHVVVGDVPTTYQKQVKRITGNVFNLLVMVNCAANFVLYSALSTKFRATFSQLFCACRWSIHTYSSAAGRDVNTDTTVAGRYSLQGGGDASAARPGGWRSGGRLTAPTITTRDNDELKEEDEDLCSLTHTTTTDKLMMSGQSGVEDLDDLHITSL